MTLKEAKMIIYANVVYACEKAELSPMTIKMVKDACDTVIALAEQADTPQTEHKEDWWKQAEPQAMCKDCDKQDTCERSDKTIGCSAFLPKQTERKE